MQAPLGHDVDIATLRKLFNAIGPDATGRNELAAIFSTVALFAAERA